MADIKKRLAHIKAKHFLAASDTPYNLKIMKERFERVGMAWDASIMERPLRYCLEPDPDAMQRAREYFDTFDNDRMVMLAMAEVLFGRHERGRSKGTITWTSQKYLELGQACAELYAKNPKLSDAKIAKLLVETGTYKGYDAEILRQRIPEARRRGREYYEYLAAEIERGK